MISYKLKLNGGDIKAVQGDSGHAQSRMVTDVYSHIVDDDRVKTARMLEESFYGKKGNRQDLHGNALPDVRLPEGMDAGLLARALETPEMQALLAAFAKANSGASSEGRK